MWWQRWQKRATSRTSEPHFGHFSVPGAVGADAGADADTPSEEEAGGDGRGDEVEGGATAAARGAGADLSALFGVPATGAAATGFSALFGAFTTGLSATGLSEVVPLMLKFYRKLREQRVCTEAATPH